ncbi:MAG: glycyl-radical enzyme activating protein [Candidatus Hecatellales archaeon]|nr:MAG: glycyl-radical enzyme activating protein [Candidatus Hecatellales archaeon]
MELERVRGIITTIKTFATHDGPGIRTTIFLKGCPLRCLWCSSPETWEKNPQIYFKAEKCVDCGECVRACPRNAVTMNKERKILRELCDLCMKCVEACKYGALEIVGREVSAGEIMEEVVKDKVFYERSGGGVTLSGGEPLYQPDFTLALAKLCRRESISVVLDTSGYASPRWVEEIAKNIDMALLDIKHMDPVKHKEMTGVSNELILENAKLMVKKCEVRISLPLIPGLNNTLENLKRTAEFARSLGVEAIDIVPFHRLGSHKYRFLGMTSPLSKFRVPSEAEIREAMEFIEAYGLKTTKGRMIAS